MLLCKSVSATNADAVLDIPAGATRQRVYELVWSYSADPTGGRVVSENMQGEELDFQITKGGPGALALPPAYGQLGRPFRFRLKGGGSGIIGTLSAFYAAD